MCVCQNYYGVPLQANQEQGPWHQVLALQREIGSLYPRPCTFTSCLTRCFKKFILEFGKGTGDHTWTDSSAQIAKQLVPI